MEDSLFVIMILVSVKKNEIIIMVKLAKCTYTSCTVELMVSPKSELASYSTALPYDRAIKFFL